MAFTRTSYSGYVLENRDEVLAALAQAGHPQAHAHRLVLEHVTHRFPDPAPAPAVSSARITGVVCDEGVQAVVVEIDGTTTRPDGKVYHITFSLAPGHKPVESNALIARAEIQPVDPIALTLTAF